MGTTSEGRSLVGLLIVFAVLGTMAGIAVTATGGGSTIPTLPREVGSALAGPQATESPAAEGAVESCRTDYEAVLETVTAYSASNGRNPTAIDQLSGWLRDPVTSPSFSITLDAAGSGTVDVATPGHPASPGSSNCVYAGSPRR